MLNNLLSLDDFIKGSLHFTVGVKVLQKNRKCSIYSTYYVVYCAYAKGVGSRDFTLT